MKSLFSPSWDSASRASAITRQPVFVLFAGDDIDSAMTFVYENPTYDIPSALARNFVCVRLNAGSEEFHALLDSESAKTPVFGVVKESAVTDSFVDGTNEQFEAFLRKYVPELPLKLQKALPQRLRRLSQKEEELAVLRAQIEADKKERQSQRRYSSHNLVAHHENKNDFSSSISASQCKLSVRLLDGETIQGTFESSQTLRDVKRWIERETGLVLTPGKDEALPSFAQTSASALDHYAFCYVGVPRVTFSVGQELSRLSDLGLCPRLALILKPVHGMQDKKRLPGLWSSISGKFGYITKALYTFFDYGLEDAERDFSEVSVEDAQPLFVVPEKSEEEEKPEQEESSSGSIAMSPLSGRGNQLHILQDRQASEKRQ